jgi:signal transduction histidine kinase/ActR/RegA family two-component response regulator
MRLADGVFLVEVRTGAELILEAAEPSGAGESSASWRGRRLADLLPALIAEQLEQLCRRCIATGQTQRYDQPPGLASSDGHFQTVLTPVCDEQGAVRRIVGVTRDITEQTRAAEAERTRAELEAQLRQAQKLEALGTLAGGIAHDFNNILGAMVAFIELIRIDVNDRMTVLEHVDELKIASRRAQDLVQRIMTFSRTQKPSRSVTKIELSAREALGFLRSSLPSTVVIESSFDDAAPLVLADPAQLHQVVMSLGTNSAHAMRERGGVLSLRVEPFVVDAELARRRPELRPGRYARIAVQDSGQGMDEATLKRIFEPFFTTKKQGEGTGLGLAVVHGIVHDHDGAISVQSRVGAGTSVEVLLPEHMGAQPPAQVTPGALPRGQGERVLVVDDEVALCVSLAQLLTRLGYRVESKSRPEEALELFRLAPSEFALVLTDLTMPGMTGLELARELLAIEPSARVVLMSGFSGTWTRASVRALGLVDMLVKPLSAAALAEGLARAIAEAR